VTLGGLKGSQDMGLTNAGGAAVAFSIGNNNQSTAYSGSLSGSGSLTKIGAGTFTLNATNSYSGPTVVQSGTLAFGAMGAVTNTVRFDLALGAFLDVQATAGLVLALNQELKGNGVVVGNVDASNGGIITPGSSIGTNIINGNLDLGTSLSHATLNFELVGPGMSDMVIVSNSISFTGMETNWFVFTASSAPEVGDYTLLHSMVAWSSSTLGDGTVFDSIANYEMSGYLWLSPDNKDVMLTVVPEPSSALLVGTGLMALFFLRRRRQSRA